LQRFYFCRNGKVKVIPCLYAAECFPMEVLYRFGFSKQAADYVTSQVLNTHPIQKIPIPYNMTPKQKKPQRIQSRGKKHSSLIDHNFN
jgi:hypothetical protein